MVKECVRQAISVHARRIWMLSSKTHLEVLHARVEQRDIIEQFLPQRLIEEQLTVVIIHG
jgi:hypothetical protein